MPGTSFFVQVILIACLYVQVAKGDKMFIGTLPDWNIQNYIGVEAGIKEKSHFFCFFSRELGMTAFCSP